MGMQGWGDKKIEALSKGMSQKVQFVASVISKPALLILDEPFSGLDPVNAESLKDAVLEMRRRGTTVVFSTHDMATAEKMCDRIFMIFKGKKVLDGTLDEIQAQYGFDTVRVRTARRRRRLAGPAGRRVGQRLRPAPGSPRRAATRSSSCSSSPRAPTSTTSRSRVRRCTTSSCASRVRPDAELEARHEQSDDRRRLRIHHAGPFEGVHRRADDDAGVHGDRVRRAEVHEERDRRQGPRLRRRRSHRRVVRAAQGGGRRLEPRREGERHADGADVPAVRGDASRTATTRRGPRCRTASSAASSTRSSRFPTDALDPASTSTIRYYSNHPGYRPLPTWIGTTVNREIMTHRFREAAIDRALVTELTRRVDIAELGLLQRDAGGGDQGRGAGGQDPHGRDPRRDDDDPAVLGDVGRAAAPEQRDRGEDEPHQRGADRIDHAVRADDGQADRVRRGVGAARRDLRRRRHRHRADTTATATRSAPATSAGCCCSC